MSNPYNDDVEIRRQRAEDEQYRAEEERQRHINDQWRIVFTWRNGHAHDVAIEDYH